MSNVSIRPLEEADAQTSFKWRTDHEIWQYTGSKPQKEANLSDELEWIKRVLSLDNDYRFAIIAENQYIGNIYLTDVNNGIAQYHIFIGDKNFSGKGFAKKASLLILDFAKNNLKLNEVQLEVNQNHIKAIALYEKLNFKIINIVDGIIFMSIKL